MRAEWRGQCSRARTRVHARWAAPTPYAPPSTATAITRARVFGLCHQDVPPGRAVGATGAGMEAIALQPSGAARRLPAVGGSRTLPRHVGSLPPTRLARPLPPPHPPPPPTPP